MPHETSLIATVTIGLVLAFLFGFAAVRLRLPPLVGYLVAGIVVGPHSPGFVADAGLAGQLAEIGVVLLMFGVGLHFSAADLMAVRRIAIPGAVGQIVLATLMGAGLAMAWGWSFGAGVVLGLALSVASTVVLLKALEERNALDSANGRVAVGWLIVEDLAMVLALVLLPALAELLGGAVPDGQAGTGSLAFDLAVTLGKVVLFVVLVLTIGPKLVPWVLGQVARAGSRELFTLSVLAVALGIAFGSAALFGVSLALGAFFAGVVLSESEFSQKAAAESLPLQDAFAVLFFLSVGILFDPGVVIRQPLAVLAVVALIMAGKSVIALAIVLALRYPLATALTVAASLAQVGEFSFILAGLGVAYGLLPTAGRDLILAGALLSIALNPLAFAAADGVQRLAGRRPRLRAWVGGFGTRRMTALQRDLARNRQRHEARAAARVKEISALIDQLPLFATLGPARREDLLTLFKPRTAQPGERLIRAGGRAETMFFLSAGAVEVAVGDRTFRLGPGEFFGEMALLRGGRRTANVTAIDYCRLLILDRADFHRFINRYPDLRAQITAMADSRALINRGIEEVTS